MESTPLENTDFRLFLQNELVQRCKRNPRYSLRSFAKALAISSSSLSGILAAQRPLTDKMIIRLGGQLGLSSEELLGCLNTRKLGKRKRKDDINVQQLSLDAFAYISEWYHFAILEIIKVDSFLPDRAWIGRALGISKSEVDAAVERLMRLGLLEIGPKKAWVDLSKNRNLSNINPNLTSTAAKMMQKQLLERATRALMEVPLERRSQTGITVAIDPADLEEARKRIQKFRRELAEFFEKKKKPKSVYQLSISLFPLSDESI